MLKRILIAVSALLVLLLIVVATRPARFRLERSLVIQATPRALVAEVADFHRWDGWSPWARLDPTMKTTFEGTPGAVGSTYFWSGNDKVGEGRMTLLEVQPDRLVRIRLEFLKPWQATNETTLAFTPVGLETQATWSMTGENDFAGKAMSLVMDMDKAVGPDFERGLAQLKRQVEGRPAAP